MSSVQQLLDAAGRRRSPATLSEFHAGRAPGNKGQRYAADPPTVDEIIAVMRHATHTRYGNRLNGFIVVLWRAGLRINEALSLTATDLEERRGSVLVRHGKNDRRRQVGMDAWGWTALGPWLAEHPALPVGPLFCVIAGPTAGHAWSASAARLQLHHVAVEAGVRRRFAPHQLRHAHAVELLREGLPLPLIQRQLGHSHLSTTGTYLQGISSEEIISTVHARRAPMSTPAPAWPSSCPTRERTTRSRDAAKRRPGPTIASPVSSSQPPLALGWRTNSGAHRAGLRHAGPSAIIGSMLRRGGALALLLAVLLALEAVPTAVAKRARHRSPCGTFCRQAGGLGGSPGTPPCKVLNRQVKVHQGLAAVSVRCTGQHTSRGAVVIYPHDIEHNSVSDGVPPGSFGGADLVCKPNHTVTLQIALSRKTKALLQRKHTLRVDVLIELNTKPVVQANTWLNLPMAPASG